MAQSMNISGFAPTGDGGKSNTLPPQVVNLTVRAEFATNTQVNFIGRFENIPAEQRKWLKSFLVVFQKDEIPVLTGDGFSFEITDTASEVLNFIHPFEGAKKGETYGFKVFSQSIEENYQTSTNGNTAKVTV